MIELTKGIPKVAGLYWYRLQGSNVWRDQQVYLFDGFKNNPCKGKLVVFNGSKPTVVNGMKREWFGPLLKPTDQMKTAQRNIELIR